MHALWRVPTWSSDAEQGLACALSSLDISFTDTWSSIKGDQYSRQLFLPTQMKCVHRRRKTQIWYLFDTSKGNKAPCRISNFFHILYVHRRTTAAQFVWGDCVNTQQQTASNCISKIYPKIKTWRPVHVCGNSTLLRQWVCIYLWNCCTVSKTQAVQGHHNSKGFFFSIA